MFCLRHEPSGRLPDIRSLVLSPDESCLVTGHDLSNICPSVYVWPLSEPHNSIHLMPISLPAGDDILCVDMSHDGKLLFVLIYDNNAGGWLEAYDFSTHKQVNGIKTITHIKTFVVSQASHVYSDAGKRILHWGLDQSCFPEFERIPGTDHVNGLTLAHDKQTIYTCLIRQKTFQPYQQVGMSCVDSFDFIDGDPLDILCSPCGHYVFVIYRTDHKWFLGVWNVDTKCHVGSQSLVHHIDLMHRWGDRSKHHLISPDGHWIYMSSETSIWILNTITGEHWQKQLGLNDLIIRALQLTKAGDQLFVAEDRDVHRIECQSWVEHGWCQDWLVLVQ